MNFSEPLSNLNVLCTVLIENHPDDIELWNITIDFESPKSGQVKVTLPVRYLIRGWLPWRRQSSLSLIPGEMMSSPNIAAGWILKKAVDLGVPLIDTYSQTVIDTGNFLSDSVPS